MWELGFLVGRAGSLFFGIFSYLFEGGVRGVVIYLGGGWSVYGVWNYG